jgi:hypothetical protein
MLTRAEAIGITAREGVLSSFSLVLQRLEGHASRIAELPA